MRHWFLTIYTWKTSLWAPSGTLLAQKPQNKILPKNLYQVNCNPIWKKTNKKTKKQKKLGATIFLKTWKTFWAYFRSFVLSILAPLTLYFCNLMQKIKKIPWIIWAPKSLVLPLFKLDDTPTSGKKKIRKFLWAVLGKTFRQTIQRLYRNTLHGSYQYKNRNYSFWCKASLLCWG